MPVLYRLGAFGAGGDCWHDWIRSGPFKGIYDANIFASLYDVVAVRQRGTAAGMLNSLGWLGGGFAPIAVAVAASRYGMGRTISGTALVYAVCSLLMLLAAHQTSSSERSGTRPPLNDFRIEGEYPANAVFVLRVRHRYTDAFLMSTYLEPALAVDPGIVELRSVEEIEEFRAQLQNLRGATAVNPAFLCMRVSFNPRAPYGARHRGATELLHRWTVFQSTRPYGARLHRRRSDR